MPDAPSRCAGTRFPLLLSVRLFDMVRWPTLLLSVCSYMAWMSVAHMPVFLERASLLGFIVGPLTLVAIFSLIAPRMSYVQCRPQYLLVSGPLYRLAVSYHRITAVGLADFSEFYLHAEQPWFERRLLAPLVRSAHASRLMVVSLELTSLPLNSAWLRLWFSRYVFTLDGNGMLLMVRDWMLLKREIEQHRKA